MLEIEIHQELCLNKNLKWEILFQTGCGLVLLKKKKSERDKNDNNNNNQTVNWEKKHNIKRQKKWELQG